MLAVTALMAPATLAQAAEVRVLSGGAPSLALRAMAPDFERVTGHRLQFTFALVSELKERLVAGEKTDLILLPAQLIAAVAKTVPLRTEGRAILGQVGIGVIVRQGGPRPDISTADAVRKLLLDARFVAFPEPSTPPERMSLA
jgi:molybdate transport system substrate-binding protein